MSDDELDRAPPASPRDRAARFERDALPLDQLYAGALR
jgi:hypothetical protein